MDAVNPSYYGSNSGLEVIQVIEAFVPDKPYRWSPLKYLLRAGKKPGQDEVQDLQKAIWWIAREIAAIQSTRQATNAACQGRRTVPDQEYNYPANEYPHHRDYNPREGYDTLDGRN